MSVLITIPRTREVLDITRLRQPRQAHHTILAGRYEFEAIPNPFLKDAPTFWALKGTKFGADEIFWRWLADQLGPDQVIIEA